MQFLTLLLSNYLYLNNNTLCGTNPTNTFFISNYENINSLKNCSTLNSSVYINGENNIYSLQNLSNIKTIHGDLVITDNTELKNLKGLQNLNQIMGMDLYLDKYSLVITDNSKLSFIDNVNWSKITDVTKVKFNKNNPTNHLCDQVCNGCYGPGPYLCQECNYYTIYENGNRICVNYCSDDNVINNNTCINQPPLEPVLFTNWKNETCLNIGWQVSDLELYKNNVNGISISFEDNNIYKFFVNDTGYTYNTSNLENSKLICKLVPFTNYTVNGILHGNYLTSPTSELIATTLDYVAHPLSNFNINYNDLNYMTVIHWDNYALPNDDYFKNSNIYYTVFITNFFDNIILNETNTTDNIYITYLLDSPSKYTIGVRNNVILNNITYTSDWLFKELILTSTTTTSTTSSSTSSSSTSSSSTKVLQDKKDNSLVLLIIYIIAGIIIFLFMVLIILYVRGLIHQRNLLRLTENKNRTDNDVYINNFETEDYFRDSHVNPTYEENYFSVTEENII